MALATGQPFLHLLHWHPRDVDTAWQELVDRQQAAEAQAREERFEAARQLVLAQMRGRR